MSYAAAIGGHTLQEDVLSPEDRPVYYQLKRFALDPARDSMIFSPALTPQERRRVHVLARLLKLGHKTHRYALSHTGTVIEDSEDLVDQEDLAFSGPAAPCVKVFKPSSHPASFQHGARSCTQSAGCANPSIPPPFPDFSRDELMFYNQIVAFIHSGKSEMHLSAKLSKQQRRTAHDIAEYLGVEHVSTGERKARRIKIRLPDPDEVAQSLGDEEVVERALFAYRQQLENQRRDLETANDELPPSLQDGDERVLRYASWNIEWMNLLFESDTRFHASLPSHGIEDVHVTLVRISSVIRHLSPDVLAIQEGPNSVAKMQLFVERYLDNGYDCLGASEKSRGDQQLYFLVKRGGPLKNPRVYSLADDFLDMAWQFDVNGDYVLQDYNFVRKPLVIVGDVEVSHLQPVKPKGCPCPIHPGYPNPQCDARCMYNPKHHLHPQPSHSSFSTTPPFTRRGGVSASEGVQSTTHSTKWSPPSPTAPESAPKTKPEVATGQTATADSKSEHTSAPAAPTLTSSTAQQPVHVTATEGDAHGSSVDSVAQRPKHRLPKTDSVDSVAQRQKHSKIPQLEVRPLVLRRSWPLLTVPATEQMDEDTHVVQGNDTEPVDAQSRAEVILTADVGKDASKSGREAVKEDQKKTDHDVEDAKQFSKDAQVPIKMTDETAHEEVSMKTHASAADDSIPVTVGERYPAQASSHTKPRSTSHSRRKGQSPSKHLQGGTSSGPEVATAGDAVSQSGQFKRLFACNIHAKSKYVTHGNSLWHSSDPEERQQYIISAVKNRRRIVAECLRIRECFSETIYAFDPSPLLIVSGDLNAGPGMDFFDKHYVLCDGMDALMGSPFSYSKLLQALLIRSRFIHPNDMWTVEFNDFIDDVPDKKCMIDHICVSHKLFSTTRRAGVAHNIYNYFTDDPHERSSRPSDHRPVFADVL
eukprot:m.301207 g.301207  ORF g.301207 m.301207 type:complete len:926 (-) comp15878_c0_seq4:2033-4810(-)